MEHVYRTRGTCSREISFELDGDRVKNVRFVGGCDGNLKAVSKLVEGMPVAQLETLATPAGRGPPPAPISWPSRCSRPMSRSRKTSRLHYRTPRNHTECRKKARKRRPDGAPFLLFGNRRVSGQAYGCPHTPH